MNPPDTVYGITVAVAVKGLLDVYELTKDQYYLDAALKALNAYSDYFVETPDGGFFWYSDRKEDARDITNVSAMLAGQYARAGNIAGNSHFTDLAVRAFNHLLHQSTVREGTLCWTYEIGGERLNDSVHASYIVYGLLEGRKLGLVKGDISPIIAHLRNFYRNKTVYEMPFPDKKNKLARVWGVGMLIATLAEAGDMSTAKAIAKAANLDSDEPRYLSHLLFGFSHL